MKYSILLALLVLSFIAGSAQEKFVPGKLISASGDTISGFVNSAALEAGKSSILFKRSEGAPGETYTPESIKGFVADTRIFVSSVVDVNTEKNVPVSATADYKLQPDTVFLELLTVGEKSLATYTSNNGVLNMYVLENGKYELLKYKKYTQTAADGRTFVVESDLYKAQLSGYLGDCESLTTKAKKARYQIRDVQKLFAQYYACKNLAIRYSKSAEKAKKEFGVFAGFNATQLIFKGGNNYATVDYSNSSNFTGGVFFNLGLPRRLKNFALRNELQYTSYTSEGTTPTVTVVNGESFIEKHKLGASYVRLNTLVRYNIGLGKMGLFVNAGVSNGFAVSKINDGELHWINNGNVDRIEKVKAVPDYRSYERAFVYGAGAIYKRIFLEARQERSNGFSLMLNTQSKITRSAILLGWRF